MQITSINANYGTKNFGKKIENYTGNITPDKSIELNNNQKKALIVASAAVTSAAIASIIITKKSGKTPVETIKEQSQIIVKKYHKKHPTIDPAIKMLNGRRDAQAVKDYEVYVAKKKLSSLKEKVANNKISVNNDKVGDYIIDNAKALKHTVGIV